jgi:hypothetical protein
MRTCPYCAEQVDEQATRCPHCQNDLGQPVSQVVPPAIAAPPQGPSPPPPPSGPPAVFGEGALRFNYSGERYILGYGQDFFGIWDRTVPGPAVFRFPRTDHGWAEAWGQFASREPRSVAVPAVDASSATPTTPFRDAHGLAVAVISMLFCMALIQLLIAILGFTMIGQLQDDVGFGVSDTVDRLDAASFVLILLTIGTIVAWCMWQYRAQRNVRAFGANGLRISPGWAVGWWFIPFANLVMPYRAMSELMRASSPSAGPNSWQRVATSPLLPLWWGFLLLGNVVARVGTSMIDESVGSNTIPEVLTSIRWLIVGLLVLVVAAVFALLVVREVDRRQTERRRSAGQVLPPAV